MYVRVKIWKRDMLEQLEAVAEREGKARDRREEEQRIAEGLVELEAWRSRRREQLERLIEVCVCVCVCVYLLNCT